MPMYDEVGMIQDSFDFRIVNNSNYKVEYTLYLADITDSIKEKLSYQDVKYYLTRDNQDLKLELLSERTDDIIDSGIIRANQTNNYSLRLWIDSKVEKNESIYNKTLAFQLVVKVTEHIPENYTIVYHTGTDEVIGNQTKVEDKNLALSSPSSLKENRIFLGWSKEENGNLDYPVGEEYKENNDANLYAVWGMNYLYNRGNQFTSDTGGWTYKRVNQTDPGDSYSFGSSYIEWKETSNTTYGSGEFQISSFVNLQYAKAIEFEYTVPTATPTTIGDGSWRYPNVDFSLTNSSGNRVAYKRDSFSVANNNLVTSLANIDGDELSSVKLYVRCYTASSLNNNMVFRLYSARVIY